MTGCRAYAWCILSKFPVESARQSRACKAGLLEESIKAFLPVSPLCPHGQSEQLGACSVNFKGEVLSFYSKRVLRQSHAGHSGLIGWKPLKQFSRKRTWPGKGRYDYSRLPISLTPRDFEHLVFSNQTRGPRLVYSVTLSTRILKLSISGTFWWSHHSLRYRESTVCNALWWCDTQRLFLRTKSASTFLKCPSKCNEIKRLSYPSKGHCKLLFHTPNSSAVKLQHFIRMFYSFYYGENIDN